MTASAALFLVDTAPSRDLAVALGIGLLIGMERERRQAGNGGFAGIRTFALAGLTGGLAAAIGEPALLAVTAGLIGAIVLIAYVSSSSRDPGVTTEIALITTFLLGALAHDDPALASGAGVVVAALLTLRERIHHFVREVMSEEELHDLLLFAAAAVVVLPLLPNEGLGPYEAINPFSVWRLVVLVMAIGGIGYVSLRLLGPRLGLPIAGLAGGFVSSAATVGSMGGIARQHPVLRSSAVSGAVLSTIATVLQMIVVLAATSRETLGELAPSLAAAAAASLVAGGAVALRMRSGGPGAVPSAAGHVFELKGALIFGATISAVLLVSATLNDAVGARGVLLGTALAGFADTHAAAISAATLVANGNLAARDAVVPILAGLTTNTITKAVAAYAAGRFRFALPVWIGLAAMNAAAWLGSLAVLLR